MRGDRSDDSAGGLVRVAYLAAAVAASAALFWERGARFESLPDPARYALGLAAVPVAYASVRAVVDPVRIRAMHALRASPLAQRIAIGALAVVILGVIAERVR